MTRDEEIAAALTNTPDTACEGCGEDHLKGILTSCVQIWESWVEGDESAFNLLPHFHRDAKEDVLRPLVEHLTEKVKSFGVPGDPGVSSGQLAAGAAAAAMLELGFGRIEQAREMFDIAVEFHGHAIEEMVAGRVVTALFNAATTYQN